MSGHKKKLRIENGELGSQAQTFTLRIWVTNREGGNLEWRGRIQHIQSGEVQYCKGWEALVDYIENVLRVLPGI